MLRTCRNSAWQILFGSYTFEQVVSFLLVIDTPRRVPHECSSHCLPTSHSLVQSWPWEWPHVSMIAFGVSTCVNQRCSPNSNLIQSACDLLLFGCYTEVFGAAIHVSLRSPIESIPFRIQSGIQTMREGIPRDNPCRTEDLILPLCPR
jgi:hypothetical protein